jgi:single-strand DNA-binding protein
MNLVIIVGRLAKDPILNNTNTGKAVCNLRVITNEGWTDANGQKQERADGHDIVVWGNQATAVAQYRRKGDWVCVIGDIRERMFLGQVKDANGQVYVGANGQPIQAQRWTKEIHADRVEFVGNKAAGNAYANAAATVAAAVAGAPGTPFVMNGQQVGVNVNPGQTVVGTNNSAPIKNPLFPVGV